MKLEHRIRLLCDKRRNEERERSEDHNDKRDDRADDKHKYQRADDGHNSAKELRKAHQKSVGELIRIGDKPADNVTRAVRVDERDRERLYLDERLVTNVSHDTVYHTVVKHVDQPLKNCGCDDRDRHLEKNCKYRVHIHVTLAEREIDRVADKNGNVERKSDRYGGEDKRENEVEAVTLEVLHYLKEGRCRAFK